MPVTPGPRPKSPRDPLSHPEILMKVVVLLHLEDDEAAVAKLLKDHQVLAWSRLELEGHGAGLGVGVGGDAQ